MKLTYCYEVREGYLYVQVSGRFEPDAARELFLELTAKAVGHSLRCVFCDITQVTGMDACSSSVLKRFQAAEFVAFALPEGMRVAVLGTQSQLMNGDFDENVMVNRGACVKLTSNMTEGLQWLVHFICSSDTNYRR